MPRLRRDEFIDSLCRLMNGYSEYRHILKLLIEQLKRGRKEVIEAKLEELDNEDW